MNKFYKSIIAVALLIIGTSSVNAQTRCTIGDKTHGTLYEVSDNMVIKKINDNQCVALPKFEKNIVMPKGKGTSVLSISAQGQYDIFFIYGENGYSNMGFPGMDFCEEVSEGLYYMIMQGYNEDWMPSYCIYDINVSNNNDTTYFYANMNDATNMLSLSGKDENNVAFDAIQMNEYSISFQGVIVVGNGVFTGPFSGSYDVLPAYPIYAFNDFSENTTIYSSLLYSTPDQKIYNITYPKLVGMDGNVTLENASEELKSQETHFQINNVEGSSYFASESDFYCGITRIKNTIFSPNAVFDSQKPIVVVMNAVDDGTPLAGYGAVKVRFSPVIYNSYDLQSYSWPKFEDAIIPFGFGINSNGQFFSEPLGQVHSIGYENASWPNYTEFAPAQNVYDGPLYYGKRTPLMFQRSCNYNADTDPDGSGVNYIRSQTNFLGEYGLQRDCDTRQAIDVTVDGNEIWNDSLFLFNNEWRIELETPGEVVMTITDDNINGSVSKANHTTVKFDLNREDAMPPSFTVLKVLNENGNEDVVVTNLDYASLNVAAGDWHMYTDPETWNFYPVYDDGAEVELYYKTADDTDFMPLEFTEVEDMFHINYGKYFNVKLSQLEGVNEKWVSMKLVVTDAAGNSQEQILENLFYVDIAWSIVENEGLTHTVYPNPFTNEVRINAAEAVNGSASISVFNVLGEQVYNYNMKCNDTKEFVIDGSGLNAGIYFYNIVTENGELKGRIVKE